MSHPSPATKRASTGVRRGKAQLWLLINWVTLKQEMTVLLWNNPSSPFAKLFRTLELGFWKPVSGLALVYKDHYILMSISPTVGLQQLSLDRCPPSLPPPPPSPASLLWEPIQSTPTLTAPPLQSLTNPRWFSMGGLGLLHCRCIASKQSAMILSGSCLNSLTGMREVDSH